MTTVSMPPGRASHAREADTFTWARASALAQQRTMQRTLQALLREQLLDPAQLVHEPTCCWLPLWRQQALLRFEGLTLGCAGACVLRGGVTIYAAGRARPVESASALLACLTPTLPSQPDALRRLQLELDNSVDNEALALAHRAQWAEQLRCQVAPHGSLTTWLRSGAVADPVLWLEQWGTVGHPWHPCAKTKLGLAAADVVAMSPEFRPVLQVPVAALHVDHARVETAQPGVDYREWFAQRFAATWQTWRMALRERGEDVARWLPLPMHPFQAQRVVPLDFRADIEKGALLLLPRVQLSASPTMSFRTVAPQREPGAPHIKLPVSLRLTSVQRTVSPKSAVMGPRLTALLRRVLREDAELSDTLDVLGEDVGLHLQLPLDQDERARHVSVLFRESPTTRAQQGRLPVPVGALFADSPLDSRPLFDELARLAGLAPLAYLARYLDVALPAVLTPYLLHGIAFEAHQQNSFMLCDADGLPRQLLLRDFGDLRVHRPTLAARGWELNAHRPGHTLFDDARHVRDKLLHAVFLCHFGELGRLAAQSAGVPERDGWRLIADRCAAVFERLRTRTEPQRWAAERHALLDAEWPAKAFLRMRLADASEDVVLRLANPLRP